MSTADNIKEVLDARRSFVFEDPISGESTTYYIANPTGEDIRKAEWQYSKVYSQAIVDEFLTQSQMLSVLEKKGIINEEYYQEVESTRTSLAAELFKLENIPEDSSEIERESIALEAAALRDKLFRINHKLQGPLTNTCENLAEDSRIEFLTSRVVENKDGSKVWKSYDEYCKEEDTTFAVKARFEVMLWLQGLESNFLENTPERTALREIAKSRLDKIYDDLKNKAEIEKKEQEKAEEIDLSKVEEPATVGKKKGRPKKVKARG